MGDLASVQAVTDVNAVQAPKRVMQELTRRESRESRRRWGRRANSPIGPAGVLATACRQGGPDATREAPAVIGTAINRQLVRARPGRPGWRRGP